MLTVLLFAQLSAAPLTPPQKPMEFPEKQPAMFARNVEIIEEARRREKGKVFAVTLIPYTDVVIKVRECPDGTLASAGSIAPSQPISSGVSAVSHKYSLKKGNDNAGQTKYNRRGIRNW